MPTYLTFIGAVNVLGALLLLAALREGIADGFLRRWTWIIPQDTPYRHSDYGRVWIWWAAIGTGAFAGLNLAAAGWPPDVARAVVWADVATYAAFELLAVAGSLSPRYGPGVHVCHVLWIGQAGWGLAVALA